MPESATGEVKASRKRGLHGWKAFLAVFVSGTAAAFLVFGIIVGGLRLVFGGLFSGTGDQPQTPGDVPQREPRQSMEVGALDLCGVAETDVMAGKGANPQGDAGGPGDSGESEGADAPGRTVIDSCSWQFTISGHGPAEMEFQYWAYVNDGESEGKAESAEAKYREQLQEVSSQMAAPIGEGTAEYAMSDAEYFIGESQVGGAEYSLVSQVKSAVYVATISESAAPEDPMQSYETSIRAEFSTLDAAIGTEIERRLPD
ncbi:hypothetical protein [Nocardiopsis coralliicola]